MFHSTTNFILSSFQRILLAMGNEHGNEHWSETDVVTMLDVLEENRPAMGDGSNPTTPVFQKVANSLVVTRGPKACRGKFGTVCFVSTFLALRWLTETCIDEETILCPGCDEPREQDIGMELASQDWDESTTGCCG